MNAVKLLAGLAAILLGSTWGLDMAGLPEAAPDTPSASASASVSESANASSSSSASSTSAADRLSIADAPWPVTADTVKDYYLDIGETTLGQKEFPKAVDGENYFGYGRVDVVDENGYDHQAMVYICRGSDAFTKGFRAYVEGMRALYPENVGSVVAYREPHTRPKTYSNLDIDYMVIEEVTFIDSRGEEQTGILFGIDGEGDGAFLKPYTELYRAFYKEYISEVNK